MTAVLSPVSCMTLAIDSVSVLLYVIIFHNSVLCLKNIRRVTVLQSVSNLLVKKQCVVHDLTERRVEWRTPARNVTVTRWLGEVL